MFGKFARAMARHDLGHGFLEHKTPRPITRPALFIRKKLFDRVVIQRGWDHRCGFGKIDTIMPAVSDQ
jgi:hypothetical protein